MLEILNVKSANELNEITMRKAAATALGVSGKQIQQVFVHRRSVDARRGRTFYVYTLLAKCHNEDDILAKSLKNVHKHVEKAYAFPYSNIKTDIHPIIVGAGPAGLFCALSLCQAGVRPILIDRGKDVDSRLNDVFHFWHSGELLLNSNVQFGEGGAGTFSDGKLTTGINDPRIMWIFRKLVSFGAPKDILWLAAPHVGTDKLQTTVKALRQHLISLGCDIRFENRLTDIIIKNSQVTAVVIDSGKEKYELQCSHLILAPGNGARDTFELLLRKGAALSPKSFSVGVRIEHFQEDIDIAQYGSSKIFPSSSYKLVEHLENGRAVYSFCVCPGGQVVAAASEAGMTVTNGMSYYARNGKNINGALLVSVSPADFPAGALGGIEFQRSIEKAAFNAGKSNYSAPVQRLEDFLLHRASSCAGKIQPSYTPSVTFTNLWDVLPKFICQSLFQAIPRFGKKIRGFDNPDAILTAAETRSSSPVRILRDENMRSVNIYGLFPCGEGAGYAGGITSSAVDGVKCAEAVAHSLMVSSDL